MADSSISTYSFSAVIQPYMPVFYVSFLATLILTPLMRVLAHRHGVVDDPDGKRKVHTQPIAYLGGVSIFLGWLAGISMAVFLKPHNADPLGLNSIQIPIGIVLGAATVVVFGLMDDVFSLSPKVKLVGQFLAALLLILPGALNIAGADFFLGTHNPQSNLYPVGAAWMLIRPLIDMHILPEVIRQSHMWLIGASVFSSVFAIFIILATCNATNLLDGLDGLCSGVTGVMSVGYLLLAIYLAENMWIGDGGLPADPVRIALSLALLGAVLGFLPFNFNPASIFMGDTGSMFLGYMCGTMILLFGQNGTIRWFLAAIIMFGLPMMDTLLAIVRRKLNGKPIFSPDSNHFHHFLIRRGLSVRQAVLLSYGVAAVFVSFGLIIVIMPTPMAIGVYLVLFGWIIVAAFKMGMIFQRAPAVTNNKLNVEVIGRPQSALTPTPSSPAATTPTPANAPAPPAAPNGNGHTVHAPANGASVTPNARHDSVGAPQEQPPESSTK
jgi:UDP-GlcNAc:undecaprenyl-phosphate GlcNAc-1-phosphate transferase